MRPKCFEKRGGYEIYRPGTSEAFQLEHQILVLDAGQLESLDCGCHAAIARRLIDDLLNVLGMGAFGKLGIYPAVDQRAPGA
jgi:hypothetical protein